ncbi:hornerin-like isoform X1 [Phoenix dactylifera]|uniref:Hornerin-like isoform X1 n=1 Tax=Phoenix dactylifera TaxID=42345 RepID=A0A8B7BY85_PHODC|nr:hornerin-like isoform X1 [Phoenix dactylifera]
MPGLLQRNTEFGNAPPPHAAAGSTSANGIWSKHRDDITIDQLQKLWSELPRQARQQLLRIDKHTLFEQARKNLYCSRCNGLLHDGFTQIVMYGKSLQQEGVGMHLPNKIGTSKTQNDSKLDEAQDLSMHPWGGLAATKDGRLTLLDCFINARSLKTLQNVFDSARARERERELLYPNACGGGGRGWISHGMDNYGRGHGIRETCALHTARLSCDTLVDFWSVLGDETRSSLLRMKEEDFMDRLTFRFDSKRFCRDCRRNVIREFKELKELKRMRREPRCTSWFCVADTAFQYEVSEDTVQADWHKSFVDMIGTYHHFEWAIGTGEGKSDILDFKDVGINEKVQVNGLDLGSLSACFITLRAWKVDGCCTELCVKAHALKGQPCIHHRLIVGDGFVTITKGESIRRFFEHAEEVEEEEDDDAMDKDGNEPNDDEIRPQKHAKSPELAREFLLDAAAVIFKEQVEKAFREGTARQNAHSMFVCLALKLLEERLHVACKEIITLEKQTKLLEEEENEKHEEEERKERRRTKEREKKLRRKERLKGKEREREKKLIEPKSLSEDSPCSSNDLLTSTHDKSTAFDSGNSVSEPGDMPISPNVTDEQTSSGNISTKNLKSDSLQHRCYIDGELGARDGNGSFVLEQSKSSRRKLRFRKDYLLDQASSWYDKHQSCISNIQQHDSDSNGCTLSLSRDMIGLPRPSKERVVKGSARNCNLKGRDKLHSSNSRMRDGFDFQFCSCNQQADYKGKDGNQIFTVRSGSEIKIAHKTKGTPDMSRPFYQSVKYRQGCHVPDTVVISKGKLVGGTHGKDVFNTKQVWEPLNAHTKCSGSSSDPDFTLGTTSKVDPSEGTRFDKDENGCQQPCSVLESLHLCFSEHSASSGKAESLSSCQLHENGGKNSDKSVLSGHNGSQNGFVPVAKSDCYSKNGAKEEVGSCPMSTFPMNNTCDLVTNSSSSDKCSSCLSEGDSSTSSPSAQNAESSSISDSEDASQQSDGRDISICDGNNFRKFLDESAESNHQTNGCKSFTRTTTGFAAESWLLPNFWRESSRKAVHSSDNGRFGFDMAPSQPHILSVHNQSIHVPFFPCPTMGYHNHSAASWSPTRATELMPFYQPNQYLLHSHPGYNLHANRSSNFCMRYSTLQPLSAPAFDGNQLSFYQTANGVKNASSKEQCSNLGSCGFQEVSAVAELIEGNCPQERSFPSRHVPPKTPSVGQNGSVENAAKSHNGSPSFSLFHFGGPVDGVAAGINLDPLYLKEDTTGGFISKLPAAQAHACSNEETEIEEYSLFSGRNGARFSFF